MNVLLILADQLSAKWLGAYGCRAASTPHLDALASRGARFELCCANHPVCMPSRASTITGRSAAHHGVYQNGYELDLGLPTFAQLLQSHGIQTLGVGKFHLECHGRSARNDVRKYGFDRAETTEDIRAGDWLDWVRETHPQHYERALATVWPMPHLSAYGRPVRNLLAEMEQARSRHAPQMATFGTWPSVVPEEACQTRWIIDRSIGFLQERDPARPFFLMTSFVDPHDPYDPPARFLETIDAAAVAGPVTSTDARLQQAVAHLRDVPYCREHRHLTEADWRTMRHHYLASMAFVDEQIGRLLAYLGDTGLADETAVIFTSDHGDMLGDHGFPAKGGWHFDACIRVPLIVAGPDVQAATVVRRAVSNLDLFPTITDLAGVSHDVPVEGMSLRPLAEGRGTLDRPDAVLTESYQSYTGYTRHYRARTVRTPQAALTLFGNGCGMLFDVQSDPEERANLFGRPDGRGLERELRDLMVELEWQRFDPLPTRGKHPTAMH